MDRYPRSDSIVQGRTGLQTYMAQVYGWMTVGLLPVSYTHLTLPTIRLV